MKKFEGSKDLSDTTRTLAERCRDYYDGDQLTSEERATLKARKQPIVINNRIAPKIDYMRGVEAKTRTDPRAFPRTPNHEDGAEAATDSIRYVCDNSDFDVTSSECFENLAIEGTEACIIEVTDKKEIMPRWVPFDRCFYDGHSSRRDFGDSTLSGVVSWMDVVDAEAQWPEAKDELHSTMAEYGHYKDKPNLWVDSSRKRVMVVEMYFKHKGVWHRAVFARGAMLEEPKPSAYINEDGEPENPMVMASFKIDRKNNRYGAVKLLLDLQDEINKRRSKALHAMNTKQTWSKSGALDDVNNFKKEVAKPDGHIEFPQEGEFGKDFGVMPDTSMSAQQFSMYQESIQQIDSVSANAANVGNVAADSGRAIEALQQGGMLELANLFDTHAQFKKKIYRQIWNRIRQFWTEEKWVRVTDDESNTKFVGLNKPVTTKDKLEEQFGPIPEGHPIAQDPRLGTVMEIQNRVEELDVDIVIQEVPDVTNLQSEQFDALVKLYQANPNGIPWEQIIQASTLRDKDKILGRDDPQAAQRNQMQQAAQQTQIKEQQLENEKTAAETAKIRQETEGEALQNLILQQTPIHSTRVVV